MRMIVTMGMAMSVMGVAKGCQSNNIDEQAENTDDQQLANPLYTAAF